MKRFIIPTVSLVMAGVYYLPWLIEPRVALGPYILAFFWFLAVWIVAVIHLVLLVKNFRGEKSNAMRHGLAALLIGVSYVIVLVGLLNGFIVTV
ncbi:MAG: hypothetical protein AAF357_01310 [Verrucomicrobiota bacterium]